MLILETGTNKTRETPKYTVRQRSHAATSDLNSKTSVQRTRHPPLPKASGSLSETQIILPPTKEVWREHHKAL